MYEARAAVLEGTKDYAKADEVFTKGIKLGARRGLRTDANSRKLGRYHALWVLDSHTALPRQRSSSESAAWPDVCKRPLWFVVPPLVCPSSREAGQG